MFILRHVGSVSLCLLFEVKLMVEKKELLILIDNLRFVVTKEFSKIASVNFIHVSYREEMNMIICHYVISLLESKRELKIITQQR